MPSYTLYYFDGRGRAEPTRLVFAYGGIEYVDFRFSREEWPEHKKEAPLGQAPFLKVDDKIIADSGAIVRYVAKLAGMVPEDSFQEAQANMIYGGIIDVQNKLIKMYFIETDEGKKAELEKEFYEKSLPQFLVYMENILKSSKGDFLLGRKMSFADVEFFNLFNSWIGKGQRTAPECLKKHSELIKVYEAVATEPKIAAWLEKRPKTAM